MIVVPRHEPTIPVFECQCSPFGESGFGAKGKELCNIECGWKEDMVQWRFPRFEPIEDEL
jgi:hypothetical protein